jgi:microcystin-dependent protein
MSLLQQYRLLPGVCLAALSTVVPPDVQAVCSPDAYYGQICWTAAAYCPKDYAQASGQLLEINGNQALYSLLGTQFGGNGITTFALPDLRGRSAVGVGQIPVPGYPAVALGAQRGAPLQTLTQDMMPAHAHGMDLSAVAVTGTVRANSSASDARDPVGSYVAPLNIGNFSPYRASGTEADMRAGIAVGTLENASGQSAATGAGQMVPIQGPRVGVLACIRVSNALYPPRP